MRLVRYADDGLVNEVDLLLNGLQVALIIGDEGTVMDCPTVAIAIAAVIETKKRFLAAGFVEAKVASQDI